MTEQKRETPPPKRAGFAKRLGELGLISLAVFTTAFIGSAATIPNIPAWYEALNKPFFNPPNWLFGPVWTLLYLIMTVSCWRVIDQTRGTAKWRMVVGIFAVQLFFNGLWPVVFFGMHEPGLALPVVIALDLSVYATLWIFFRIDRLSGLALVPYALWVSFASVLNLAIYGLNLPSS